MPAIIIIGQTDVQSAWNWLKGSVPTRVVGGHPELCFTDLGGWGDTNGRLLHLAPQVVKHLSVLYCASQFGLDDNITNLVNANSSFDVTITTPTLEGDIKPVISSSRRFRDSLSEHLAFWVHLALVVQNTRSQVIAKRPHVQPEDKGPDGLLVEFSAKTRIEVTSVKNSINSPRHAIATAKFRKKGKATRGKQLDDFWHFVNKGLGLTRLHEIVGNVCRAGGLDPKPIILSGLNNTCLTHAVVVADHAHCSIDLFEGYKHVGKDPASRLATYIGSQDWKRVAEASRKITVQTLKACGVWQ